MLSVRPHFTANDTLSVSGHTEGGLETWNLPIYASSYKHDIAHPWPTDLLSFQIFSLSLKSHSKRKDEGKIPKDGHA